jgi:CO/xanthine dehydrogenase Mo-binding subunit
MTARTGLKQLSRRSLLTSGLAGGFLFAFHVPARAVTEIGSHGQADSAVSQFAPNAFIRIGSSGRITLVMPQVEMGQGVYTAIPMILAEELDADLTQVVLEHAPPNDALYANPIRLQAIRIQFAHGGSRCGLPARPRARCWCGRQPRGGTLIRQSARRSTAR